MHNQNPPDFIAPLANDVLTGRRLIGFDGPDAASFLQNIMSNDIEGVTADKMVYSCLLTPQGQYLHDFFVFMGDAGRYIVDIADAAADDFLRRLTIFKLRAKVTMTTLDGFQVYAGTHPSEKGFDDPRLSCLGKRFYLPTNVSMSGTVDAGAYTDFCIAAGVPSVILPQKDVLADVNLDLLNAVSWDKGCFIGQEVTARMHYRALAKKRLLIVSGENLAKGQALTQDNMAAGDIREVSTDGRSGLAVARLMIFEKPDVPVMAGEAPVSLEKPHYINR